MLDAPIRKVAKAVLNKLGTPVVIRRVTGSAYSTTTGTMMPSTSDTTVKARIDDYTDRQFGAGATNAFNADSAVRVGDRKVTLAASDLTFQPSPAEKVLIGGIVYNIIRVDPTIATDEPAIYTIQVRR